MSKVVYYERGSAWPLPKTTELDKLSTYDTEVTLLGEFLDWLEANTVDTKTSSKNATIYRFLGIDPLKVEAERSALLKATREEGE
jgi:hypothetical protein